MLFALLLDKENQGDGLEGQVGDVADAESQDEGAGFGDVGEGPSADDNKVKEEGADSESEEVLDKGARVFIETFDHGIVLQSGDDGKVERDERHNGLEHALCEPQCAESSHNQDNGQQNEGYVVLFHDSPVFGAWRDGHCAGVVYWIKWMVSLVVNFSQ